MSNVAFPAATIVGYPRVGRFRELKKAQEAFWKGKTTLQELADTYGVSAERVRQLEKNALKKLKDAMDA